MSDLRLTLARDLREIQHLYADLRAEAISHADDGDIPGGDAMVMLGPSADPEAWSYRQLSAALGRTEPHGIYENDADPQPPLLVLATWEDCIRKELGTETDRKATIEDAAKFLASSIDWCLDIDAAGDVNFIAIDDMAADIAKVRKRLEVVLHAGEQRDVSRVTCTHCDHAPRLVKTWARLASADAYHCPSCRTPYDWGQFLQAKATNLRAEGTERFVLATQAEDAVPDVPKQTMRSWMRRGVVKTACDIRTKRVVVWWPDVREAAEARRVEALAKLRRLGA
jgi:hypothetical protein